MQEFRLKISLAKYVGPDTFVGSVPPYPCVNANTYVYIPSSLFKSEDQFFKNSGNLALLWGFLQYLQFSENLVVSFDGYMEVECL